MTLLECRDVAVRYGNVTAVDDVSLEIPEGKWISLVGPNGAGKTSLLNLISGFVSADQGDVLWKGESIGDLPPYERARRGLSRTFQHGELFEEESVVDNLAVVRSVLNPLSVWEALLYVGRGKRKMVENIDAAEEVIDFFEMWEHRNQSVASLPLGIRRRVGFARALMLEPDVILMDELTSGLTFEEKFDIVRLIAEWKRNQDITYIMVEHDLEVVTGVSDRMIVLNQGETISDGDPETVIDDPEVSRVYTGVTE
jgi:branched-chain amino acid transport system ATP-binding protein